MNSKWLIGLVAGAGVAASASSAPAQDTAATQLPTVTVEVGRGTRGSTLDLPFAVTVQTPDSTRPGQRHLSLDETLWLVPGLSVSNRNNPSQDPRISIRGFGARSSLHWRTLGAK